MKKSVYHKWVLITIFLGGLLLFLPKSYAQQPTVKASVDKNSILIGDQFHFKVAVSMPDNTYRLSWFNLPDTVGNFRLIKQNKIDSTYLNGNLNFSQDITLTSFDSGRQVIPSFVFNFETLQGDSAFKVVTDSIPIQVLYSPMDSVTTFHDIKSILEVKKEWPWWWWGLLLVAVILLGLWVRFLIKFFKKKKSDPGLFSSKLSPYDEAMKLLKELDDDQLPENNEEKQFHTRLNEIFKRFVSRKTNAYKMNLTSDEIIMELDSYDPGKETVFAFANCLRMSDAVKFAKYIPPINENKKCLEQTREVITEINNKLNKKQESAV